MIDLTDKQVILLEGTRKVKPTLKPALTAFAQQLAERYPEMIFRSGNATGSDELFAKGVESIAPTRMEQVLPYPDSNKKRLHQQSRVLSLSELNTTELHFIAELCLTATPSYKNIVTAYLKTMKKNRFTVKAIYLLRNALKVTGLTRLKFKPADFGIFYVDPDNPTGGGTGHTIRMCELKNIPVITQQAWLQPTNT
ncbi:MAG: hypothetical protein L3J71_16525 [Victivallaceae bacterium]|nr:hypothetical protein [Victivallaceae bacterium]